MSSKDGERGDLPAHPRRSRGVPPQVGTRGHSEASAPVALITGTSSGFGLLTAVELARAGHRVFASMRDLGRADRLRREAAAGGVIVETLALDVTRPESIDAAVSHVLERAGGIDVLVNNAGFGMGGFLEDLELTESSSRPTSSAWSPSPRPWWAGCASGNAGASSTCRRWADASGCRR